MPARSQAAPADAVPASWVEHAPHWLQPWARLARLDRPIGTWLLFWPCVFGLILGTAADERRFLEWRDLYYVLLFGIGALVMRGAGCTFNDIVDRKIDAQVARTRARPIPSGAISVKGAVIFLILQCLLGLAVLIQFNWFAVALGASSLLLVAGYPFMKRITWWPQAWLGLTFNWGALLGWAAATGRIDPPALWLYAGGIAWTMVYDTIYAHQDKEDDALIGVRSTARLFGAASRTWLAGFAVLTVALFGVALYAAGIAWPGWVGLGLAALHLAWQVRAVDFDDPADCLAKFRANRWLGWIFFLGLIAARLAG